MWITKLENWILLRHKVAILFHNRSMVQKIILLKNVIEIIINIWWKTGPSSFSLIKSFLKQAYEERTGEKKQAIKTMKRARCPPPFMLESYTILRWKTANPATLMRTIQVLMSRSGGDLDCSQGVTLSETRYERGIIPLCHNKSLFLRAIAANAAVYMYEK